ncbi:hypothetical protein [Spirosoma arcticum]
MSAIQAPHGITYNGKQATEYIWLPALTVSGLEDHFKVVTGVNSTTQVTFAQQLDKITQRDSGCTPVYNDFQIPRTEKFWNPKVVEATLTQCYTDVYGSSFEQSLRAGTDRPKLEGTDIEQFILDAAVPAAARDLLRMVYLSKYTINSTELTGGSGDVKNYNQIDGIWTKNVAAVVAGKTPRYVIAENTATTTAGQKLAVGRGQEILREVYDQQDIVMMQMSDADKLFEVTRSVYMNYYRELESNKALESSRAMLTDGQSTLTYMGIKLRIMDVVDRYLISDFTFGTGANKTVTNPHRVLLSVKDNLQVSIDTPTAVLAFQTWDEPKDKRWYGRGMIALDTQIAIENLNSTAY